MAETVVDQVAEVLEDGFADITKDGSGGCLKKVLVQGTGEGTPPPGSKVWVHYVGTLHSDGSKFDSSRDRPGQFDFTVGVGQVIKGWDIGICSMKKGEKALLRCTSDYAYGDEGSPPKIPGGATLNFEVELFSWKEKVREPHEMSLEERVKIATEWKDNGTDAFRRQEWAEADDCYFEGVRYITFTPSSEDKHENLVELDDEGQKLAIALLSNCAAVRLKLNQAESAVRFCSRALEFDALNVKALFRRAQAQLACESFDGAIEDAAQVLKLDSSNVAAQQLAKTAERGQMHAKKKEKAIYSKMFK